MATPLLEIRNLSAGYDGKRVLHDINLTIYENDFLGMIGPNGGGKTTLVRCILGLLKPFEGEICGCPVRSMGYLPQYSTIDRRFPITVEEVILSGLAGQKPTGQCRFTADDRALARDFVRRMGLEGLEHRSIGSLSGGQMQRALLARAVIADPRLLILDEPGTYLDRRSQVRLYELLADINRRCAILLVSHDIGTVLQQVRSVACVDGTLHYHPALEVTAPWLEQHFGCPIELLGHGALPHRILHRHES